MGQYVVPLFATNVATIWVIFVVDMITCRHLKCFTLRETIDGFPRKIISRNIAWLFDLAMFLLIGALSRCSGLSSVILGCNNTFFGIA